MKINSLKSTAILAVCALVLWNIVTASISPPGKNPSRNFALVHPGILPEEVVRIAAGLSPSPRQLAWQELEFIAFAHFGMNTFTDREWGEGTESPSLFNPTAFDAGQWVRVIKDAGMKLLIVTAKHHDGFCLWPTKLTDHCVRKSPWRGGKGDVVGDVARACHEANLKFGVYLSPWDRHERTYGDSPAYNEFFRGQLRELLTNYGDIAEVWFDGACGEGPNGKKQVYDWPSYYKLIRELQPEAVIAIMGPDVRWVGTESGYGRETEWSVVPVDLTEPEAVAAASQKKALEAAFMPKDLTLDDLGSRERITKARALAWYPAETDVSIRPGWFYHANQDEQVKTPEKLIDIYFSSVGRNSVLLLNIPPDKRGLIHENDAKNLAGMRKILDDTFKTNFSSGARVKAKSEKKGFEAGFLIDADKDTSWAAAEGTERTRVEIDMKNETSFDCALLREDIRTGQRVEKFRLESWDGSEWLAFAQGTTIGYKRLLRFPAIKAKKVRLTIEKSRKPPVISSFGLYKLALL